MERLLALACFERNELRELCQELVVYNVGAEFVMVPATLIDRVRVALARHFNFEVVVMDPEAYASDGITPAMTTIRPPPAKARVIGRRPRRKKPNGLASAGETEEAV
jgi:hypothetical protein